MPTSDFVQTLRQASSRTTKPLALNGKGRLTTASDHAVSVTMLAASLSGTSVRIDGMYPRRMSRQAESNVLRKIFEGLSDPDRDYDVVMVSKGGKSVVNVLSRTPGQLTSVADMYAPANGAGDWFWSGRGARTVATPQAMASVERLCDVFGYEGPEAMYAMADGSEYRDPVEMVAFANRIGHAREGNLMPLRGFDAGSIASALSLDKSVAFHANDPVRSVMESGTSMARQVGDATVADVVAQVTEEGVDPVCVRYDNQLRSCVVGRCADRVVAGLNGVGHARQEARQQALPPHVVAGPDMPTPQWVSRMSQPRQAASVSRQQDVERHESGSRLTPSRVASGSDMPLPPKVIVETEGTRQSVSVSQPDSVVGSNPVGVSATDERPKGFRGLVPSAKYQFELPRGLVETSSHVKKLMADARRYEGYGAKTKPGSDKIASVRKWMDVAGVTTDDIGGVDRRAGMHLSEFLAGRESMTKSLQDWVEYQLDVPEGRLFAANYIMRSAEVSGDRRPLRRDIGLADLVSGMRDRGYALVSADGTRHAAVFARSEDVSREAPNANDRRSPSLDVSAQKRRFAEEAAREQRAKARSEKARVREVKAAHEAFLREQKYGGKGQIIPSTDRMVAGVQAWMDVQGVDIEALRLVNGRMANAVEAFMDGRQGMVESVRGELANALGIPSKVVFSGASQVRRIHGTAASNLYDDTRLASIWATRRERGDQVTYFEQGEARFDWRPSVKDPTPAEMARDELEFRRGVIKATPECVDSVMRWMAVRGVTCADLLDDSFENRAVSDFVHGGVALPKRVLPWLEEKLDIPEGCAFEARHQVGYVHVDKTMRGLGHTEELADVIQHMGTSEFRCAAVDFVRGSVAFERTAEVDMGRVNEFLESGFANDVSRDMAAYIMSKTITNGANPDIESVLSERLGVPVMGGIAEASASAIMDVALGLRSGVAGYDRDTCMDVMCGAVRQMVEEATEADVSVTVEKMFAKRGYHVDLTECSESTLNKMAKTPGHLDHLPWSQRDEDGVWHSMVRVENTIFVEDGRGITAYPLYETTDVTRSYNILCASMDGIAQKDATSRLVNLSDESFEEAGGEPEASEALQQGPVNVNGAIADRNKSRGHMSPSSHYRRGFFGLRTCGPQHSDYRITYVSACSVGVDEFACDLTRVHKVDERGVLSRESQGAFLVEKLLDGRQRMFDRHRELATRYPDQVKAFDSIDDVVVEIHTNDPHLMDGVDTRGVKYRIVTGGDESAHSADDIELC